LIENRDFFQIPPAFLHFDANVTGPCQNITITFGTEKTRMMWLPRCEKKFDDMFLHNTVVRQTDKRRDGHLASAKSTLM